MTPGHTVGRFDSVLLVLRNLARGFCPFRGRRILYLREGKQLEEDALYVGHGAESALGGFVENATPD